VCCTISSALLKAYYVIMYVQVCAHCCKYIDPSYDAHAPTSALPANILALQDQEESERRRREQSEGLYFATEGVAQVDIAEDVLADLEEVSEVKRTGQFKTVKSRNLMAVEAIQQELDMQKAAAKFEEVKFTTAAEMDTLLSNL
jgi:hypothetical protein